MGWGRISYNAEKGNEASKGCVSLWRGGHPSSHVPQSHRVRDGVLMSSELRKAGVRAVPNFGISSFCSIPWANPNGKMLK